MKKATTVRLSEDMLKRIDEYAQACGMERGACMRKLIGKGLVQELQEAVFADYAAHRLSAGQACEALGVSPWEFVDLLRAKGMVRNVTFEDWVDSAGL